MALGNATILHGIEPDHLEIMIRRAVREVVKDEFEKEVRTRKATDVPEMLTRKEAAKFLSVSASTLDNWAAAGKVSKHRSGATTRFKKSELLANFQSLQKGQR